MAQISPALPIIGGNRGDGESALRSDVQALLNEFNGNIDASNLANVKPGYFLELLTTGTRRRTAFGQATLAFAASNIATVVVTHGLGITPVAVLLTPVDTSTNFFASTSARSSTSFTIRGRIVNDAVVTFNFGIDWLAIG
jgi:hypothetical protein